MKLKTNVILLFLSAEDNGIFVFFLMSQVWTMKLTESMNSVKLNVSVRVSHTIKVNITFMGNNLFLQMFIW